MTKGASASLLGWIHSSPCEAETRFLFLNNHRPLDWRDGHHWLHSHLHLLAGSLKRPRKACAFT